MIPFTHNIKFIREERGLTQAALAEMSGLAASQISNIECGERLPSMVNLIRLRKALGCEWKELLD